MFNCFHVVFNITSSCAWKNTPLQGAHWTRSLSLHSFKNLYSCCRLTLNTNFLYRIAHGKALVNSYNYQKRVDELPHT
jgi:hypothetical protein